MDAELRLGVAIVEVRAHPMIRKKTLTSQAVGNRERRSVHVHLELSQGRMSLNRGGGAVFEAIHDSRSLAGVDLDRVRGEG